MKRIFFALLALTALTAGAADLDTDDKASITVRTRTEFDQDLGDASRYALMTSFPELSISYNLLPHQSVGGRPRSSTPVGFISFDIDTVQLRYSNGAVPDYNNPSTSNLHFGFNDPASTSDPKKAGYFGPVYMPNMRSGIAWGDWTLQLAAAGGYNFWNPWNHEYEYANETIAADWALLDTRVQYRRGTVSQYVVNRNDETNYWSFDNPGGFHDTMAPNFSSGSIVALEYGTKAFAARGKFATRLPLAQIKDGKQQGLVYGTDVMGIPLKNLTLTGSVAGYSNYTDLDDTAGVALGGKAAYGFGIGKGLTLLPAVGYDYTRGSSGPDASSQEASASMTLEWPGDGGWYQDYLHDRTGQVYPGVTVAWKVLDVEANSSDDDLQNDVRVTLFEEQGDGGLLKFVGAEWAVDIKNVTKEPALSLSAYHDVTVKYGKARIVPWVKTLWDRLPTTANDDKYEDSFAMDLGVKVDQIVPKALFGITWESGDLVPNNPETARGLLKFYTDITL